MFLKLDAISGYSGIIFLLLIISYCYIITLLTSLSLRALLTNGEMKGNGVYYIISRSAGPELGGATGILFYAAQTLGGTTNIIGCAELFISLVIYSLTNRQVVS